MFCEKFKKLFIKALKFVQQFMGKYRKLPCISPSALVCFRWGEDT